MVQFCKERQENKADENSSQKTGGTKTQTYMSTNCIFKGFSRLDKLRQLAKEAP